ncbi:hypothetical protein Y032_0005g2619 [Ancylostoma ceylanicum]|uniref:SHSP domain-containing protein n=1 Tax=Ancylostoma ceylanicum TaxID=53326 RepID=A0A016VSI8_9BILA|nr:hypothetical protein Y032_0005g2619 [Ancylostoma ceylanicum]
MQDVKVGSPTCFRTSCAGYESDSCLNVIHLVDLKSTDLMTDGKSFQVIFAKMETGEYSAVRSGLWDQPRPSKISAWEELPRTTVGNDTHYSMQNCRKGPSIAKMDLWQVPRAMNRMMNEYMRDFDRLERSLYPYWREADHSVLHVANETQQVVDDDKKFAVSLDVSQFRPEELNVHLEGRELTVEGKQEHKGENSFMHRSFVRKWTLPETVDLEAVRTQLSDKGHLCVEAPKTGAASPNRRNIPIMAAPSNK